MEKRSQLLRYYKYGLIPIVILWVIVMFSFGALEGAFFLIGFMWPYLYYTPGFEEKAQSKAYKYSFLGNIFKIQRWLLSRLGSENIKWKMSVARLIVPFVVALIVGILNPSWSPLWCIFGWAAFEVFFLCNDKKNLNLIEST